MKKFEHMTRIFMLVGAFCFALSIATATVHASSSAPDSHGAAVEQTSDAAHGATDAHGTDATQAGDHGGGHGEGSLSAAKLKDLFWRIVNFIALMIILVKFGAKPIASALGSRQQSVKHELEDLETRKADAERQYRQFEAKLATVEKDIDKIVEKAVAQAEVEKSKILEKAEAAVADMKRQAELAVQNEIVEARRSLKNEITDQAAVMAEELIVKNLTADDQVKIIENYLDKVGAVQ
ncbi:MAG: ATP synthase F0 subunit B [Desulfofustis sp.]|jgi:F-type H+-transporting ATPase subunit b|nr:ATP synthase F0 subunit B [Desulfofustis sp.]